MVSEQSTGFPGYNSIIAKDKATIGRILKDNGYATSWFGKDHNTPTFQASQVGPFDQWPIGMGFEYFYGFVGGDTSQWEPNLFRNTTAIYPYVGNPGWNLTTAMADDAIDWLNQLNQIDPEQAVLLLLRARRHPRAASPDAASGSRRSSNMHLFDKGWNELRNEIFANQKRLGVIPPGREAHSLAGQAAEAVGRPDGRREEDVHPPGRGLCRLPRLHRPRDRPRHPGGRGHGQARQHAHHLHQRRQRLQRRRHAGRHAQRGGHVQRRRSPGRGPVEVLLRRLGHGPDLQPHGDRLDLGLRHAVQLDQADRLALRRHPAGHVRFLAAATSRTPAASATSSIT